MWTLNPQAILGASKTGLAGTLRFRVLKYVDGTVLVAYTTAGVQESAVPGVYTVPAGIGSLPDSTAVRVEWGTVALGALAEEVIDPNLAAVAVAVQVTSDHGAGSYVRNTEPPTVGAIGAQITADHGVGSYVDVSGGGTGARTVTVTVTDGTNPVQNAKVRATLGLISNVLDTDASGHAVFLLDDGTWALAATAPGYQGATGSVVVSGTASATLALTAVVIVPPADPLKSTAYTNAYAPGVSVVFTLIETPTPDGHIYDGTPVTGTADGAGLLQVDLYRGGRYKAYQGTRLLGVVDVPDADTYELPDWLGGA